MFEYGSTPYERMARGKNCLHISMYLVACLVVITILKQEVNYFRLRPAKQKVRIDQSDSSAIVNNM